MHDPAVRGPAPTVRKPGEPAKLYYDGIRTVEPGDYLRTRTGRTYLVTAVRVQKKGRHVGRQHLQTVVMDPARELEPDAVVHPLWWYRR